MRSRRGWLAALAATAALPLHAREPLPMPPGGRPWRIGWLSPGATGQRQDPVVEAFVAGMRDKGWVRDEHYAIDLRWTSDARQYPALAAELVALSPDVLMGVETSSRVLRRFTTTIPIVMFISIDPVAAGLVESLARPGTNVTGMSGQFDAVVTKWIEALIEIVPQARRIAYLADPSWSDSVRRRRLVEKAARTKGVELETVDITTDVQSVRQAFLGFEARRPDGLVIPPQGAMFANAAEIQAGVRRLRLPAVGVIEAGSLVQIGPSFEASARESADFVDRIFRGARPADLPVRQVMTISVTVDARRAREIGVTLPVSMMIRADRVIE